ncbi:hypothetical protein HY745_12465 [Candidatus Desantisbacteria bacterium]|nr:hypothetical protein [Candidatus Desantisbacteria bacterium]
MKSKYILLFILILANQGYASFSYCQKKDLIRFSDIIAIIKINKVENTKWKGNKVNHVYYLEKSTAEVKEVLKGKLPKDIFLYGEETYICGQCNFKPGEAIVFLQYDSGHLIGINYENCSRPITNGFVEWYEKDDDYYHDQIYVPLKECIEDIKSIIDNREPTFPLTFKNKIDFGNCNISGRVYDEKTNQGIEGITVILTNLKGVNTYKLRKCEAVTNKNGEYFIKNAPSGNYKLSLWDKNDIIFNYAQGERDKNLDLKGHDFVDVNFKINRLGSIEGTVYDIDGKTLLNDFFVIPYKEKGQYISGDFNYRILNKTKFTYEKLEDYDSWRLAISFRGHFYLDDQPIKIKNAEKVKGIKIFVKESQKKPSLYGALIDKTGNDSNKRLKLINSTVELWSSNNATKIISIPDKNLSYAFYGIPAGKYRILYTGLDTTINYEYKLRIYDTLMIYETSHIKKNMVYDLNSGVTGRQFYKSQQK